MDCPICFCPLNENPEEPEKKRRKTDSEAKRAPESTSCCTPCGHIFHRTCMEQWLDVDHARTSHRKCPLCKCRLKKKWLYPAYLDEQMNSDGMTVLHSTDDESEEKNNDDECECANPNCQNLNARHNVLNKDYEDLQLKYALLQKHHDELTIEVTNLKQENENMKGKINDTKVGNNNNALPGSEDDEDEYDNY